MAVGGDELVKGFEYEKGAYVLVSDEDLHAVPKEAVGAIEVIRFVDGARVDPIYYCHAHYLMPRRKTAIEAFALFRQAMIEEKKLALARVVIRNTERLLAIAPYDGTLVAFTLHHPEEIGSPEDIKEAEKVKAAKIDKQSLHLAKSLIRKTTGEFVPEELSGDHSKILMEIIRAKVRNEQIKTAPEVAEKERVASLIDALEKSIQRAEKQLEIPQTREQEPTARRKAV
jgi:DNA end-binding protein Ku